MKKTDMYLIAVVVIVSGVAAFFISDALFASPKKRQQKAEVVEAVTADFQQLNSKYFNAQSLNPTKQIKIGDTPNTAPFNSPKNR